jgi:hypothetical protein
MVKLLPGALATLVFVLIISVWNWITSSLPGSPGGHVRWIVFLMALITALVVYYYTATNSR